ncbi:yeats family-domain-containing protein [Cladochytrium replicatum]|nr:yeats family-domain-containing protein [Cladochytrium replicatum]
MAPPAAVRKKGVVLERGIIFGNSASPLTKKDVAPDPQHTHKWCVYVRGVHGEDLSYMIKKVQFKLHESFVNPSRVIEKHPFEVWETGWGQFEIQIRITFVDPNEKAIQLYHMLTLFPPDGDPSAMQPPSPALAGATKKPVVAEVYEDIVFNEPTELMYEVLMATPQLPLQKKANHQFTAQAEHDELKKLVDTQALVLKEIEAHKAMIARLGQELKDCEAAVKAS